MNPPKVRDEDYIQFVLATPKVCSALEAARVQPKVEEAPAHDAFTRLLHRLEPDALTLWQEAASQVERQGGVLVVDDSTLDKPYAEKMDLVQRHVSGKHHAVVEGINLITLLWTDGDRHVPVDYRVYDKDRSGLRPVAQRATDAQGTVVHLKGYGLIRVFLIVASNGDREYWATNDLHMTSLTRIRFADFAWTIETYHRGIKQYCGVERAQVRAARAQRNHIGLALRAFLRLERYCYRTGLSWFEAKLAIIRPAIRAYLTNPLYTLPATA